jgi:NTE family protein
MTKKLAFVLGGGGARGALQVGALRALHECGYSPDLLVGTSIGAANASFMAINGLSNESLESLVKVWQDASTADLLPANYVWLTVRSLFNRSVDNISNRLQGFYTSHDLPPTLRFGDINKIRLILVATDLNSCQYVLYGLDPQQSVLEGVLASTALPPWVSPMHKEAQLLVDGGFVSNLPIEPALSLGATEIIALDLHDPRSLLLETQRFGGFLARLINTIEARQQEMELALAQARNIPLHHISLRGKEPINVWDFSRTEELISQGYEITLKQMKGWHTEKRQWWQKWMSKPKEILNSIKS